MLETPPILIAEDNPDDSWLLAKALRHSGISCNPHFVENGEQAIAWLQSAGDPGDGSKFPLPRLLITDIKMPRTDGFGLIQWVRSEPRFLHLPIIVLSSSSLAQDVERASLLGATCCMQKSTDFSGVIQYLRSLL